MTRIKLSLPWMVGLLVFLFYAVTRAPGFSPGESAFALLQALPDSMFPTFGQTLWHSIVRALDALPLGDLALKSSLFAAFTGAVSAAAVASIASRIPLGETPEELRSPVSARQARIFVVSIAVVTFVFSPPIWFASTRALPQMFGLMCLLVVSAWTLATFQKRSPWMLNVAAVLWGWLVTEYATAWFFLGFFALALLLSGFDVNGRFRWGRNLRLLLLLLLGAFLGYGWMSFSVLGHPHAELQEIRTLGEAWWNSLKVQKNLITQAAPLQGSLLVFFLFGGPLVWTFWPKQHGTLEVRIGSVMLHCACAVINGIMLFHPGVSPWGMYLEGRLGVFMVAPSAMLAISTGYICGYFRTVLAKYDPYLPPHLRIPKWILRLISLPVMLGVIGVSTLLNLRSQHDPDLREVNRLASAMAESIAPYEVYMGESGFNHVLKLLLHERNLATRVLDLNPALWQREAYRKIIASWFADRPRLAALAEIGPSPLLHAWAAEDPDFDSNVLLGDLPDLLFRAGRTPLSTAYGYIGRLELREEDVASEALFQLWESWGTPTLWGEEADERNRHRAAASLRVFFAAESRRANNHGVFLESKGRMEDARRAYRLARRLRSDNVSALLNLAHHLPELPEAEQAALNQEVEALVAGMGTKRHQQWRLAEVYGYVSHPLAHMERGLAWAVSGKPNLAAREYEEALRRAPGAEVLRLQLAQARLAGKDLDESEAEFLRVLEANPESMPAILGLSRVYALRGDTREALVYIGRLREMGAAPDILFREETAVLTMAGRLPEAAERAEAWIKAQPDSLKPMLARMVVALEAGQRDVFDDVLRRAELIPKPAAEDQLVLAQLVLSVGDAARVRSLLAPLLEEGGPLRVQAAEIALRSAVASREEEAAERWVRVILADQPGHAFANYIMGTLRYAQGRMREAESALRASVQTQPSPGALNDLAYLLLETGRPEEALGLADQSLALERRSPSTWDTRADILLRLGKLEEARASQSEALAIAPEHPPFQLTFARILSASGQTIPAREIVDRLLTDPSRLSPGQQTQLRELSERLSN